MAGWVSLVAAGAATLILTGVAGEFQAAKVLNKFFFSLVYSFSIGLPSALIMLTLGRRRLAAGRTLRLLTRMVVLLGTTLAGCLVAGILLVVLRLSSIHEYWQQFRSTFLFAVVITLTFGLSASLYQEVQARLETAMLEVRTRQVEEERARKLAAEARLASLESRVHPHFLFNTLNSIAALIPRDPQRAEDMIGKLASLLRFSLNAQQASLVPLRQEMEIVRAYLEIEKARFDTRLRYTIEIAEGAEEFGVPPLAIESLVENSIKHVIAKRPEGGEIRVAASTREGRLEIDVGDTGPGFAMDAVPLGHGLDSLSGRLALLFGPGAGLKAVRNGKYASVCVTLPRRV